MQGVRFTMQTSHLELHVALTHIVRLLVDEPTQAYVVPMLSQEHPAFNIHVAQAEVGKIIGKNGRTARAIRVLVAAYCMRVGERVAVDIVGVD